MRSALTLIELILSIVIIGIVFTVIPKLVQSMNQTTSVTIKEEAMYDALTRLGQIINLPWDNNNTQNPQILQAYGGDPAYECNTTGGYRIGGFAGGRNCIEPPLTDYNASIVLGQEDSDYNDLDDYADTSLTAEKNCTGNVKGLYGLDTRIGYVNDPASTGTALLSATPSAAPTNTKHIVIKVGYGADSKQKGCITEFQYDSFNIGTIQINSRKWN